MSRPTPVGRIVIRPSDDTKAIIGITKGADPSLKPGMVYEIRKDDSGAMTLHEVGESCIRGPSMDEDTRQDAVFSWAHDLGLIVDAMGAQCVTTIKETGHIENIDSILEEQKHHRFMNMRQYGYAGSPVLEFFFPRFEAPRSRPKEVEQKLTEMFGILEADPDAALKMIDAIKEKYANIPELSKAEVMIWKRRALAADDKHEDTASTTEPTKGDTAPMSQPITEQDVAEYLTKYIQTSELVPDAMKALFIGRVTNWQNTVVQQGEQVPLRREMCPGFGWALEKLQQGNKVRRAGWNGAQMWLQLQRPDQYSKMTLPYIYMEYPKGHIAHPDGCRIPWLASQSDMLSYDWQIVSEMPVPISAPSASVARMTDTTEPLTMSITRDDDGHMCIAIADRKWKIMRHGIIGNGKADREEFHQAASDLVDNELPFSEAGLERVVLASELLSLSDDARAYRNAMAYRASVKKTLGEVMYDAFCQTLPASAGKQPAWEDVVHKYSWETAATAAYLSVGLDPENINDELQIVAARKRMQLLRSVYVSTSNIGTIAAEIAAIAGPTKY